MEYARTYKGFSLEDTVYYYQNLDCDTIDIVEAHGLVELKLKDFCLVCDDDLKTLYVAIEKLVHEYTNKK